MTIQEFAEKITEAWGGIAEAIEKLTKALQKAFEKIEEHKRLLRRPPKWYAKANNPAMIVKERYNGNQRRKIPSYRDKATRIHTA